MLAFPTALARDTCSGVTTRHTPTSAQEMGKQKPTPPAPPPAPNAAAAQAASSSKPPPRRKANIVKSGNAGSSKPAPPPLAPGEAPPPPPLFRKSLSCAAPLRTSLTSVLTPPLLHSCRLQDSALPLDRTVSKGGMGPALCRSEKGLGTERLDRERHPSPQEPEIRRAGISLHAPATA